MESFWIGENMNHTHAYVRMKRPPGSKDPLGYYQCAFPDCTHSKHKGALIGKLSVCLECQDEFILTAADLKKAKPLCPKHDKKGRKEIIKEILDENPETQDLDEKLKGMFS